MEGTYVGRAEVETKPKHACCTPEEGKTTVEAARARSVGDRCSPSEHVLEDFDVSSIACVSCVCIVHATCPIHRPPAFPAASTARRTSRATTSASHVHETSLLLVRNVSFHRDNDVARVLLPSEET